MPAKIEESQKNDHGHSTFVKAGDNSWIKIVDIAALDHLGKSGRISTVQYQNIHALHAPKDYYGKQVYALIFKGDKPETAQLAQAMSGVISQGQITITAGIDLTQKVPAVITSDVQLVVDSEQHHKLSQEGAKLLMQGSQSLLHPEKFLDAHKDKAEIAVIRADIENNIKEEKAKFISAYVEATQKLVELNRIHGLPAVSPVEIEEWKMGYKKESTTSADYDTSAAIKHEYKKTGIPHTYDKTKKALEDKIKEVLHKHGFTEMDPYSHNDSITGEVLITQTVANAERMGDAVYAAQVTSHHKGNTIPHKPKDHTQDKSRE